MKRITVIGEGVLRQLAAARSNWLCGYEIYKELSLQDDAFKASLGSLVNFFAPSLGGTYATIDGLLKRELIVGRKGRSKDGQEVTQYQLTDKGRKILIAIDDVRESWSPHAYLTGGTRGDKELGFGTT